jgi:hypothetical protein
MKNSRLSESETEKEKEFEHPGYYWLAYEWTNLLPSCYDCNSFRRHGTMKAGPGKNERFPV